MNATDRAVMALSVFAGVLLFVVPAGILTALAGSIDTVGYAAVTLTLVVAGVFMCAPTEPVRK